jgi:hypothetical protein
MDDPIGRPAAELLEEGDLAPTPGPALAAEPLADATTRDGER